MLYEKQYAIKALQQCTKIVQSLQYNIRPLSYSLWTYCVFIRKFAVATKNLETSYTFFTKPSCFLLIQETRRLMTSFSMTLTKLTLLYKTNIDIL